MISLSAIQIIIQKGIKTICGQINPAVTIKSLQCIITKMFSSLNLKMGRNLPLKQIYLLLKSSLPNSILLIMANLIDQTPN